jgi:hypothetical protein
MYPFFYEEKKSIHRGIPNFCVHHIQNSKLIFVFWDRKKGGALSQLRVRVWISIEHLHIRAQCVCKGFLSRTACDVIGPSPKDGQGP